MSIIFGLCKPEEELATKESLMVLAGATERYALDGTFLRVHGRVGMGFQPYYTHQRSNHEVQPLVNEQSDMLVFDGRLDNCAELADKLDLDISKTQDSFVVFSAFARWKEDCFSRLIGDWALALWTQKDHSLYLARDHAGTRTLYYAISQDQVLWSTSLETMLQANPQHKVESAYVVCCLASLPVSDLTPYIGVKVVKPAHYLRVRKNQCVDKAHWTALVGEQIVYKEDWEYDDHFLHLFGQAIERRTGPGAPILAHLSGGRDSTSIVCMSDHLHRQRGAEREDLLDTVSIYDPSDSNWDDSSYFSLVESRRGRLGIHFDASLYPRSMKPVDPADAIYLFPGADSSTREREVAMNHALSGGRYRVILSGTGGDEMLGGVPTGSPELSDYFVRGKFPRLFHCAFSWSIASKRPLIHTLWDTVAHTFHTYRRQEPGESMAPPWLLKQDVRVNADLPFGPVSISAHPPSVVNNAWAWWMMQETLPHLFPEFLARLEYRYPYLDRDLVDYLLRIPRSQIVAPSRSRLLMRRALRGIVPDEILDRRRKAYVVRKVFASLETVAANADWLILKSPLADCGYIDSAKYLEVLGQTVRGIDLRWALSLLKTAEMSLWLLSDNRLSSSS